MQKLSSYFYQKSTLSVAILLSILTFAYLFFAMMPVAKCFEVADADIQSLGTSFGFSLETVRTFLSLRSAEMLDCFESLNLIWDNLFALLYGLMYVAWISFLFNTRENKLKWLNLVPFLQTILDWVENLKLAEISKSFRINEHIASFDVQIASLASMAKWICAMLVFGLVIVGIFLKIKDALSKRT